MFDCIVCSESSEVKRILSSQAGQLDNGQVQVLTTGKLVTDHKSFSQEIDVETWY